MQHYEEIQQYFHHHFPQEKVARAYDTHVPAPDESYDTPAPQAKLPL
jgi:hypothetical protein